LHIYQHKNHLLRYRVLASGDRRLPAAMPIDVNIPLGLF
jgi:hypothetical protein